VDRYEQSVQEYGVTCCHHTCGNLALQEYMQGVLPSQDSDSSSSSVASKSERSSSSSSHHHKPAVGKDSPPQNQTQSAGYGTGLPKAEQTDSASSEVEGFVMEAVEMKSTPTGSSAAPMIALGLVFLVLFMIWMGFHRKV